MKKTLITHGLLGNGGQIHRVMLQRHSHNMGGGGSSSSSSAGALHTQAAGMQWDRTGEQECPNSFRMTSPPRFWALLFQSVGLRIAADPGAAAAAELRRAPRPPLARTTAIPSSSAARPLSAVGSRAGETRPFGPSGPVPQTQAHTGPPHERAALLRFPAAHSSPCATALTGTAQQARPTAQ